MQATRWTLRDAAQVLNAAKDLIRKAWKAGHPRASHAGSLQTTRNVSAKRPTFWTVSESAPACREVFKVDEKTATQALGRRHRWPRLPSIVCGERVDLDTECDLIAIME